MYKKFYYNVTLFLLSLLPATLLLGTLISELAVFFISILFLVYCSKTKNWQWIYWSNFKFLIIIFLFLIINLIFSKIFQNSFSRDIFFFRYIIYVFALTFFLKKKKFFNKILFIWSIILFITIFDLYFEYIFGHNTLGFVSRDPLRLVGFLGEEEKISTYIFGLAAPVFSWIYLKISKKNKAIKFIYFIILILFLYSIIISGSRTINAKLIFFIIALLFLSNFTSSKIKIFSLILFLLFSSFLLYNEKIRERNFTQIFPDKNNIIAHYKNTHYAAHHYAAFEMFKENYIFGVGNKNFRIFCEDKKYENKELRWTENRCSTHPHQIYLEFLSEQGLVGFIGIVIFIIFKLIKYIIIFYKNKNIIGLSCSLYLITYFLPIIPSGSFFTSFTQTFFWTNFAFINLLDNQKSLITKN